MLTVKPVYKLLNVSDDQKWTTNKPNIGKVYSGNFRGKFSYDK